MPLKRNQLAILVALTVSCFAGCSDRQLPQTIVGTLANANGPSADRSLRLYESFETCEGAYVEARTNDGGAFEFHTSTWKGAISEVTQSFALCEEREGKWMPLWSTITGGGAETITLTCGPPQSADAEFCDMKIQSSGSAA